LSKAVTNHDPINPVPPLTKTGNSLITPKTEMDRFIHDQFPYPSDNLISSLPYNYPKNPSKLGGISDSTV